MNTVSNTFISAGTVTLNDPVYTSESTTSKVALIVGVTIAGITIVVVAVVLGVYLMRRRAKISGDLHS